MLLFCYSDLLIMYRNTLEIVEFQLTDEIKPQIICPCHLKNPLPEFLDR